MFPADELSTGHGGWLGYRERMHLVWDWNGTLFRDLHAVLDASRAALGAVGAAPVSLEDYRLRFRRPIREFHDELVGRVLTDDEWRLLDDTFHHHYHQRLHEADLAEDALAAMDMLDEAGWSQSLLSMWRHEALIALLPRWPELGERLVRVDGDHTRTGDTKEHSLRAHLAALGISADDAVLIGDTVDDARAARAVGAGIVLVAEGSSHTKEILAREAEVVDSLTEAVQEITRLPRG